MALMQLLRYEGAVNYCIACCLVCLIVLLVFLIYEIGAYEPLLETARRRKLQSFGHTSRRTGTLACHIMHGSVNERVDI